MKNCIICDKELIKKTKAARHYFCSNKCRCNAYHRARQGFSLRLKYLQCIVCGKNFFQSRVNNTKYCTKNCKKLGVSRKYHGRELAGPKKHIKGSGYIQANGYRIITLKHPNASKRNQILEHVLVMSNHLGRPLHKGETVHHKNGIRDDNRIENLELWSSSHPHGQRVEDKVEWCKQFLNEYGFDVIKK